jgi:BirA family transcriptional regulator, biotin operon repressor / biotin---[acetyl-CoA-carboxylase] ligase
MSPTSQKTKHVPTLKWSVQSMKEVASTQRLTVEMASHGSPEGTVIVAESQSDGRGRTGRSWVSPRGGLYMSLVLRPRRRGSVQTLPLLASFSVARSLRSTFRLTVGVRWPNDLTVNGRKLGGVIADASVTGGSLSYAVLGIGINCNSSIKLSRPDNNEATTLKRELGREVDLNGVRSAVLRSLRETYLGWSAGDVSLADYLPLMTTLGKLVEVKLKSSPWPSRYAAKRLLRDGSITMSNESALRRVNAEDVEWLRELS